MDDIKLLAKNEKGVETLIHTIRIYCPGIGIEFGIEKCDMLVMKSGKRHLKDGMELTNQDKIRMLGEKETYKYLGISEADTIKQVDIKEKKIKISQENQKATRDKTVLQKPYQRNKYLGYTLVRYSGPFLKRTREELKQMNQRTKTNDHA